MRFLKSNYRWMMVVMVGMLTVTACTMLLSFSTTGNAATEKVNSYYSQHLQQLLAALQQFRNSTAGSADAGRQQDFTTCRTEYKYVEALIEYYHPNTALRMNGPAVPEVEPADINELDLPSGFQVLEEAVYDADMPRRSEVIQKQLGYLISYTQKLYNITGARTITAAELYDALRLNLYRLAAKGLSGFDSPVAHASIAEAVTTIQATKDMLEMMAGASPVLQAAFDKCSAQLKQQSHFEKFNYARFIATGLQPLLQALYKQQVQQGHGFIQQRRAVRANVASMFDAGAFDPYFFAPDSVKEASPALLALGQKLFAEPVLSLQGRSCASCHQTDKAYTDGLTVNESLQSNQPLTRNTPTLLNAALQPLLFYDGRAQYLEDQVHEVLANKAEMNSRLDRTVDWCSKQSTYKTAFAKAWPTQFNAITEQHIVQAVVAYTRSLQSFNTPFDAYMRGDTMAMNKQQVAGFNLFMGKAQCGTCHYMPLFNGVVPPTYGKLDTETIGVPADTANSTIDNDPGAFTPVPNNYKRHAFKTPTLRNIALTAPYMHNGVYATLEQVIDFYDKGGGAGLGLTVPNQTLSPDPLLLTPDEKQALIAFMQALTEKQFSNNQYK
jgi:cytochrome c peroxidase